MLSSSGRYLGVDVSHEAIEWCQQNVTPKYPNVKFFHINVKSSMYNPGGQVTGTQVRFSLDDGSVDRIFLCSVFTHMLEDDIRHYLDEFKRVLKPDGLIFVTWFIIEDGVLESARAKPGPIGDLTFRYPVSDDCFANDPNEVLGAVAYKRPHVEKMVRRAGFDIEKLIHGYWSQFWGPTDAGQDVTILRHLR